MGCGWAKGAWVLLAVLALPLRAGADFVHLLPPGSPTQSNVPVVLPPRDTGSTGPSETPVRPQPISTESDSQPFVIPQGSSGTIDVPAAGSESNLPQGSPIADSTPSSQGVRPIALNSTAAPGVPEPSMLVVALIAAMVMVITRRQRAARAAASDRA